MTITAVARADQLERDLADTRRLDATIIDVQERVARNGLSAVLAHNTRPGHVPASYVHHLSRHGMAALASLSRSHLVMMFDDRAAASRARAGLIRCVAGDPDASSVVLVAISPGDCLRARRTEQAR